MMIPERRILKKDKHEQEESEKGQLRNGSSGKGQFRKGKI